MGLYLIQDRTISASSNSYLMCDSCYTMSACDSGIVGAWQPGDTCVPYGASAVLERVEPEDIRFSYSVHRMGEEWLLVYLALEREQKYSVRMFDMSGALIGAQAGSFPAGRHSVRLVAPDSPGMHTLEIRVGSSVRYEKIMVGI